MSGTPPSGGGGVGSVGVTPHTNVSSGLMGGTLTSGNPADHFCLRWNNYQINMTAVFDQLLQEEVS